MRWLLTYSKRTSERWQKVMGHNLPQTYLSALCGDFPYISRYLTAGLPDQLGQKMTVEYGCSALLLSLTSRSPLQGKLNVLLTAERKVYCGTMLTSATLFTSNFLNSLGSNSQKRYPLDPINYPLLNLNDGNRSYFRSRSSGHGYRQCIWQFQ